MGQVEVLRNDYIYHPSTIQFQLLDLSRRRSSEADTGDLGRNSCTLDDARLQGPIRDWGRGTNIFDPIITLVFAEFARIVQYRRHEPVDGLQVVAIDDDIRELEDVPHDLH